MKALVAELRIAWARVDFTRATLAAFALGASVCLSACGGAAESDSQSIQQGYQNFVFETEAVGNRVLSVNWALGDPLRIVKLRIPEEYLGPFTRPGLCHPFSPGTLDPNCQYPHAIGFSLELSYAPLGPPSDEKSDELEQMRLLFSSLARVDESYQDSFVGAVEITQNLYTGFGRANDSDISGMKLVAADARMYSGWDMFIDGDSVISSTVAIFCPNDESTKIHKTGFMIGAKAPCKMHFAVPELRGIVELTFRRAQIASWKSLKAEVGSFLVSLMDGKN